MSRYPEIAIIGLGLIGSSLARVIKSKSLCDRLVLFDADVEVREKAVTLGLGDVVADDIAQAVAAADLVVMAIPVGAMANVAVEIAPYLKQGVVITDTGSTKGSVIKDVSPALPDHGTGGRRATRRVDAVQSPRSQGHAPTGTEDL